jgi:hypothetical protein
MGGAVIVAPAEPAAASVGTKPPKKFGFLLISIF